MNGYMLTPLGDRYRIVYYLGKKWLRVESRGFWAPVRPSGDGWTTCVRSTDDFGSCMVYGR